MIERTRKEREELSKIYDLPLTVEGKGAGMKIKKMEVGTNDLKKYLFLFIKGHLNNGLTLDEVDDILTPIVKEIFGIFLLRQSDTMTWKREFKDVYPFLYDKDGEQIGSKEEEYKDVRR